MSLLLVNGVPADRVLWPIVQSLDVLRGQLEVIHIRIGGDALGSGRLWERDVSVCIPLFLCPLFFVADNVNLTLAEGTTV